MVVQLSSRIPNKFEEHPKEMCTFHDYPSFLKDGQKFE